MKLENYYILSANILVSLLKNNNKYVGFKNYIEIIYFQDI